MITKSKILVQAMLLAFITSLSIQAKAETAADKEKISVLKNKETVYIQSYLSPEQDVVLKVAPSKQNGHINFQTAGLVDRKTPMTAKSCQAAKIIHHSGDDAAPWLINSTYIGANHGAYVPIKLTSKQHGLTQKDLGTEWTDDKGKKFYLIKISSPDQFWMLSENIGKDGIWRFHSKLDGKVTNKAGKELAVTAQKRIQLRPANRIQKQAYLVDGKTPLADGKVITCNFLDIVDNYDIIAPDSLLEKIRSNPGKKTDFTSKELDSVLTNNILYRFQPRGACTVLHKAKINRKINLSYMGFIQTTKLLKGKFSTHEYHIPKTVPYENKGVKYDFSNFQDFSKKLKSPQYFKQKNKNLADPKNLPDRWIQFLGDKSGHKVGYVVGYSLLDGISHPEERAKNTANACFIHTSKKTYPYAISVKKLPAGREMECLAYRQYFSPSALSSKASSSYLHKQGENWILYLHYHTPIEKDLIKLPELLTNKNIEIIEKTPTATLLSGNTVPAAGITVSSNDKQGYIVLKIK